MRRPNRVYTFSMRIWLPSNWVTVKVVDGEDTVVPTVIAKEKKSSTRPGHSVGLIGRVFDNIVFIW